ncbi:hypothetical protein A2U01_0067209 [Trifolium medium]|uniref:Uncharacterized protein n=1 Tax=Trifolium medium TaxID=97028 RepID=A0A392SBD1_9FABA|nr:hypothetical protein [Trifolium medium]
MAEIKSQNTTHSLPFVARPISDPPPSHFHTLSSPVVTNGRPPPFRSPPSYVLRRSGHHCLFAIILITIDLPISIL